MENLNLEKFSPKRAELQELSQKYLNLEIKGIDDKPGYLAVDEARKELKRKRVKITKTGKELRSEALAFQKAVIAREKELVEIIEPVELSLSEMQKKIDDEKEKIKRIELLPERKEKLEKINVKIEDDFILLMDDGKFESFYNEKKAEYLEEKERLIREQEEKMKREQEIEEAKKQARVEAEKQAEAERKRAIEEERRKAQEEKEKIIREQEEKERARVEAEKQAEAERERKEKNKRYTEWLEKNGYTEKNKNSFYIHNENNKFILYKKVDEIIIK
jgi:hypothetical protein